MIFPDSFPYHLRREPCPENALVQITLILPNPYAVNAYGIEYSSFYIMG